MSQTTDQTAASLRMKEAHEAALQRRSRSEQSESIMEQTRLARAGRMTMTIVQQDPDKIADELLEETDKTLTIYNHYDKALTPREVAMKHQDKLTAIYWHAQGTYKAAKRLALDAWKNRDWLYLLSADEINPDDMATTFRKTLECMLLETNSDGDDGDEHTPDPMRADWIQSLTDEVAIIQGPLSDNPIDPSTARGKRVVKKVRQILEEKQDTKGLERLNKLLEAGGPIGPEVFERTGTTRKAREVAHASRYLDPGKPKELETKQALALLGGTAKEDTIRAWLRNDDDARLPRYEGKMYLMNDVDAQTGKVLRSYWRAEIEATEDYLQQRAEDVLAPVWKFGIPQTKTRKVIVQKGS